MKGRQKGFGLLGVIVAMGVMSVLMLGYMNSFSTSLSLGKFVEGKNEIDTVWSNVKLALRDPELCKNAIKVGPSPGAPLTVAGLYVASDVGTTVIPLDRIDLSGSAIVSANQVLISGAVISNLDLKVAAPSRHIGPNLDKHSFWLELQAAKNRVAFGGDLRVQSIVLDVVTDSSLGNNVSTCSAGGGGGGPSGCRIVEDRAGPPSYSSAAFCNSDEVLMSGGGSCEVWPLSAYPSPGPSPIPSPFAFGPSFIHTSQPTSDGRGWTVDCYRDDWSSDVGSVARAVCCKF